jgi:hypothetical protein
VLARLAEAGVSSGRLQGLTRLRAQLVGVGHAPLLLIALLCIVAGAGQVHWDTSWESAS